VGHQEYEDAREEREAAHKQATWALNEKLLHLEELVGDDNNEAPDMPEGYVENKGKIPGFNIPVGEGMYLPAK
jgi:hypothetical protein